MSGLMIKCPICGTEMDLETSTPKINGGWGSIEGELDWLEFEWDCHNCSTVVYHTENLPTREA